MSIDASSNPSEVFCRKYDLSDSQNGGLSKKDPAPHQSRVLSKLAEWYRGQSPEPRGTILVLPTGGGKTFTAVHFACRLPLSDGYKVLWLAHTHYLLEQAFYTFDELAPELVSNRRISLTTRVVSGTVGHYRIPEIRSDDDVLIASLQSTSKAFQCEHPSLLEFIRSANGKLLVVFDEAHHSPAPSYRRLLQGIRKLCPNTLLLGLTATPTYTDQGKIGWLSKLFPQELGYQVTPQELMAAGVLAKPHLVQERTNIEPDFSDEKYNEWIRTNSNLPESVVSNLANTKSRNRFICDYYAEHRDKFGKTILFADRWEQCEFLCECLEARGVKAGAIYSHVAYLGATPEERNRRTRSSNDEILDRFRKNELDVLVNIQMATEGVDIPDAKTVFLTRQTTSQILLTQMVGRALRGAKFGGTADAYIVAFIDDWKHRISWASYGPIIGNVVDDDDDVVETDKQPPKDLISVDLIRRLTRQMDSGIGISTGPFKSQLPVGWYSTKFDVAATGADDVEARRQLVLVYEDEYQSFERFVDAICQATKVLTKFEDVSVQSLDVREELEGWKREFFSATDEGIGASRSSDLLAIARHAAQGEHIKPRFFRFEERDDHDLDRIAAENLTARLDRTEESLKLEMEFKRDDRFWRALYPTYLMFKSQYDFVCNRIQNPSNEDKNPPGKEGGGGVDQNPPETGEPPESIKDAVKKRDGFRCLCCGEDNANRLEIDHIKSKYLGGNHDIENLQTLCSKCNGLKKEETISFRSSRCPLIQAPDALPELIPPRDTEPDSVSAWECSVRRCVNVFFRCSAVKSLATVNRSNVWTIELNPEIKREWLDPHLTTLIEAIQNSIDAYGDLRAPKTIVVRQAIPGGSKKTTQIREIFNKGGSFASEDGTILFHVDGWSDEVADENDEEIINQPERPQSGGMSETGKSKPASPVLNLQIVLEAIRNVEGFAVQVLRNGRGVRGDYQHDLSTYDFKKCANGIWTVKHWLESRFFKSCPSLNDGEFEISVLYGDGRRCPSQTQLRSVRDSYH